jgi:3-dehydroquinate synthase
VTRIIQQTFSVGFDYPVVFTRDVFAPGNSALLEVLRRKGESRRFRAAVFVDDGVAAATPGLIDRISGYFLAHGAETDLAAAPRLVPGGERCKNEPSLARELVDVLIDLKMDRQSHVLAVGGGAVLDVVGYAAALVHRGLRLVRLPTTVLAQNDAGVGVKNAINWRGSKNMLGTFAPPFAVINDFGFLATLPDREWTDGIAEAFKVAIIKDAAFFGFLVRRADDLRQRSADAMEELIVRCAELHLEHIRSNGDPFEMGRARPLDFGHWAAHKLEVMSRHRLSHGSAVAIGVALDSAYAVRKGWLATAEYDAIHSGLSAAGFTLWDDALERRDAAGGLEVLGGLRDFQEHLGGELCVTMPRGLGAKFEVNEMDPACIAASVGDLKARAGARP